MSQTTHQVIDVGDNPGKNPDDHPQDHPDRPQSAPNPPSQGESNFGDSSGPFFSIYSKTAEEEDNKMVDRWQKDADGILIFTGLFSAAVAALLALTVPDLRPNSQDTSAFYLGNIYGVLADPNATRASIPLPVNPPPFSPPRYAVWVNTLWFLSLVMSLSCALWATSLHQWARRYIRHTQPARCCSEKRARMRAYFANGVDKMRIPWAVEGLPTLLHLSLFLFFVGLGIFLFNVHQEVFIFVVSWIGFFSIVYGFITLLPLIRHDSPYNTPLSTPAWFLYARIQYVTLKVLTFIACFIMISPYFLALIVFKVLSLITCNRIRGKRCLDQITSYMTRIEEYSYPGFKTWHRYSRSWMSGGVEKKAEETASKQSSEIDVRILGWTISALGDDESLEKFFETIPGLFNSKLVKNLEREFPLTHLKTFWQTLDGLMGRTLSSNSVTESTKSRRSIICNDIIGMIPCPINSMRDNLRSYFDQAPLSMERFQAIARWFTHNDYKVADHARVGVAKSLASMQERDDAWFAIASDMCGLAEQDLRNNNSHGKDNVLLSTFIHVTRQAIHSRELELVWAVAEFDICHTLPTLQHDFCTLWNELVQEAKKHGDYCPPAWILRLIRHHHIALHEGPDAAPTAFSLSTDGFDPILWQASSYALCDIASHRPDSTAHVPVPTSRTVPLLAQTTDSPDASPHHSTAGGNITSQQVDQANIVAGPSPSDPTTSNQVGHSPQVLAAISESPALLVHTSPRPTDSSPPGAGAPALQDTPLAATLSCPPEETISRDVVAPCAKPDTGEILSTASMPAPTLATVPESTPPVLGESSTSCDEDTVSASDPMLPALSVISSSVIGSPPPSRVPLLPNAEILAILDGTAPFHPTGNAALPHLRARGLVNTMGMCFANAVLQLLVHSPPLWNLFKQLGDLKELRGEGGPATGGGATPLVDATVRFYKAFMNKEEPPPTRQAADGKPREGGEAEKEPNVVDSFEPTYIYDAMKDNGKLKCLLDDQQQDAEEFFRLYLDALDEELITSLAFSSGHDSATSAPGVERKVSQSGQTDVVIRNFTAESVESPLMRIFGGKFRSTVRSPNQPDSVMIEDWRSLQLDIQHDSVYAIENAVARISHLQPVQLGLSGVGEGSQQVLIETLPPVLVLHLKRFLYDAVADCIVKISKPVRFAPELEIPLETMASVSGKSADAARYKLYGVLYHHGESADSGHYTVDVLHPNEDSSGGDGWLHIDDEAVRVVRPEDVFGVHDNEQVDDRCAYMLFYCRTAFTGT